MRKCIAKTRRPSLGAAVMFDCHPAGSEEALKSPTREPGDLRTVIGRS